MTTLTHKHIAFVFAAIVALAVATPSFAKTAGFASAPPGDYINNPNGCVTDEGYGRSLPCVAGAY